MYRISHILVSLILAVGLVACGSQVSSQSGRMVFPHPSGPPISRPAPVSPPPPTVTPPPAPTPSGGSGSGTGTATSPPPPPPPPPPPLPTTGYALLSWIPPTTNTDGSPLTNLAGYDICYGTSPDTLNTCLTLDNPGLTLYEIDGLATGHTWYFVMLAFNTNGTASEPSNEVHKTL